MSVVIYKIKCKDTNILECYVGSTTNMNRRKNQHIACVRNYRGIGRVYGFILCNGGMDNWEFEILKVTKPTDDRFFIEQQYIIREGACLNSATASTRCKHKLGHIRKNYFPCDIENDSFSVIRHNQLKALLG